MRVIFRRETGAHGNAGERLREFIGLKREIRVKKVESLEIKKRPIYFL